MSLSPLRSKEAMAVDSISNPSLPQILKSKRVRVTALSILLTVIFICFFNSTSFPRFESPLNYLSPSWASGVEWNKFAYVQYATNTPYLCNSLMIFEALHRLGAKADRLLMYPEHFHPGNHSKSGELLEKARDSYGVILNPIKVLSRDNPDDDTWEESYTKLLAFNQTQYDRVLSLDSDATVLQSMDELFLLAPSPIAMPRAYWLDQSNTASALSSQLMLVEPSTEQFELISKAIESAPRGQYDMEIVNNIYKDTAQIIPHRPYDLLTQTFRGVETAKYLGNDEEKWNPDKILEEAKYLHFSDWPVRKKPWLKWKEKELECDDETSCRSNELWLHFYSDFAKRRLEVCGDVPDDRRAH